MLRLLKPLSRRCERSPGANLIDFSCHIFQKSTMKDEILPKRVEFEACDLAAVFTDDFIFGGGLERCRRKTLIEGRAIRQHNWDDAVRIAILMEDTRERRPDNRTDSPIRQRPDCVLA